MPLVWIDGLLIDKNDARINVFDHGFLHGDGVFEGLRLYGGQPFLLVEHLAQFRAAAQTIGLTIPPTDAEITTALQRTLEANPRQEGYIRLIATRGPGTLALDPRKCESSLIIIVDEIGLYPRELAEVGMHVTTLPVTVSLPLTGSLSRGVLVPLRAQALQRGYCEALLFDTANRLLTAIEAVAFFKLPSGWIVPPRHSGEACPVYRQLMGDWLGTAAEVALTRAEIPLIREGFLACAAAGIVPIDEIDGFRLPEVVGPDTLALRQRFRTATANLPS